MVYATKVHEFYAYVDGWDSDKKNIYNGYRLRAYTREIMNQPVFQQLASFIESKIKNKFWLFGERLPSIRYLVAQQRVSKNTVIRALIELEAKGLIEAKPKVGYFVIYQETKPKIPHQPYPDLNPVEVELPFIFYDIMQRGAAFDVLPKSEVGPASKHLENLQRHLSRALRSSAHDKAMYYDSPLGNKLLREQISERYRSRGLLLNHDNFCITSGCQHSLFLALLACCKEGDNVAVESPAFYGVVQLLEQLKLNIIEISSSPVDGMDTVELNKALQQWKIKACVVTPAFATPTGAILNNQRKQSLIELANQYDFTVIEDDIYGELSFKNQVSPLKSLDTQSRVILCGSFSKALSRDIRIGWIAAGKWHQKIVRLKLTSQLASSQSQQEGLASFLQSGAYRKHLDFFNVQLEHQRNQLVDALEKYWPASVRYAVPSGGLSLWVELDKSIDSTKLYAKILDDNIIITPGSLFTCSNHYRHFIRLSFNHATVGKRLQAIKILGNAIKHFEN